MQFDLKLYELDPAAAAAGARVVSLDAVGSTNEEARHQRGPGPLWVTALAQTRGRGRRGRTWESPQGNLYASLVLRDPAPVNRAAELAFVSALAVRDAVIAEAPALAPKLALKWPNDLLIDGEKCAGILIEGEAGFDGGERFLGLNVIVGIGVNCLSHPNPLDQMPIGEPASPETMAYPATDLLAHGADVPAPILFKRLSATMIARIGQWNAGEGLASILRDWLAVAYGVGERIAVRCFFGDEKKGRFAGLDDTGRLLLELADGTVETIAVGDVFMFSRRGGRTVP
jgi:BirA family transcriptional regulator, biotin operon repressor / biotin---[acetyl-CoA-carboxylase] ligase